MRDHLVMKLFLNRHSQMTGILDRNMRSIWPVWQIRASLTPDAARKSHSVNNRARRRKDDAVEIGWLMMQIEPVGRHQIDVGQWPETAGISNLQPARSKRAAPPLGYTRRGENREKSGLSLLSSLLSNHG
jgi:hypothetical protein